MREIKEKRGSGEKEEMKINLLNNFEARHKMLSMQEQGPRCIEESESGKEQMNDKKKQSHHQIVK